MVDVADMKANQLEIKAKLDLVLQFEKKMDLLLQILSKKEEKKEEQGGSSVESTPPRNPPGQLIVYQSPPSVHEMAASKMNVPFKRRKLVNTKLKDFTNPSGK